MSQPTSSQDGASGGYPSFAQTFQKMSETYYRLGQLDAAQRVLQAGSAMADTEGTPALDRVAFLLQYGKILSASNFYGSGEYELTFSTLARALQIAKTLPDQHWLANAIDLVGRAYYNHALNKGGQGFEEAQRYFQQALELREALHDKRGMSETLLYLGLVHENALRDPQGAQELYTRAFALASEGGYALEESYAARHLGLRALEQGNLEQSRTLLETSLALREELGYRLLLPFSLLALGDVCLQEQDLQAAFSHFERASGLAEELNQQTALVFALLGLGDVRRANAEAQAAREQYERAYALAKAQDFQPGLDGANSRLVALEQA